MDVPIQPLPFDPSTQHGRSSRPLGFQVNGLKHDEAGAIDSASLHELYFGSLGADGHTMEPACRLALEASFGSVERWRDEFVAMGKAPGGASGWVLMVFQPHDGTLVNQRAVDPTQVLAGGVPVLALDLHTPADPLDSGAAAGANVDAFMAQIDWGRVYRRYQQAVQAASEPIAATHDDVPGALLLDVRRAGVFEQATTMIPGATWRDPACVAAWAAELPAGREVVVYCVYGHEVGRSTAMRLRAAGVNARFLQGGFDGWKAAGRPLVDKGAAS